MEVVLGEAWYNLVEQCECALRVITIVLTLKA